MGFLLKLVPVPYMYLAIVLMVGAVWGHGWLKGRSSGMERSEEVIARIQVERDQQAIKNGQALLAKERRINEVIHDFHLGIGAINAYWLRNKPPIRLPSAPKAPEGATGPVPDSVPVGQYRELERLCAITTKMFNSCRDGWRALE